MTTKIDPSEGFDNFWTCKDYKWTWYPPKGNWSESERKALAVKGVEYTRGKSWYRINLSAKQKYGTSGQPNYNLDKYDRFTETAAKAGVIYP